MWTPLTQAQSALLRLNWRRRSRRKHSIGLRISNVASFFETLNRSGIPYIVLRWFEEVPLTRRAENEFGKDIDLLVDGMHLPEMLSVAFRHRGPVRCDLYTDSGVRGTTFNGVPYYPPAMAADLLRHRVFHRRGFAVPEPRWHLLSLVYHLVYHKGIASGIETGLSTSPPPEPTRDYQSLLRAIAAELRVDLPSRITLVSLHEWLRGQHVHMPMDLLMRWPNPTAWHQELLEQERSLLQSWAQRLPHLYLFLIREDARDLEKRKLIHQMLSERLKILHVGDLTDEQVSRAVRGIRGGNWMEHKRSTLVPPWQAVACYDFHPQYATAASEALLAENTNLSIKHEIRRVLNHRFGGARQIHALHGSDNAYETQHMIQVIWSERSDAHNQMLLSRIENGAERSRPAEAA